MSLVVDVADVSFTTVLVAAVLVAAVGLLTARCISNAFPGKKPPIWEDIPFVGGLLKFAQGPNNLLLKGYARFGEVFTVPVLHKRVTFLLGPYATTHFFKAGDDEMSQKEPYEFSVPVFGNGVVFDVDQNIRSEQFRIFADALKGAKLKSYVPWFVREAEDFFKKWPEQGVVDLKDEFDKLIVLTASRTLLGREVRENMCDEVADLYHDLDMGMQPLSVFFPYLPTAAHKTRDKALVEIRRIFKKIIANRRASGVREDDLLQHFMDAKYQKAYGGRQMNDEEVTGMLIAGLFAGQHTSTITSAWTGLHLAERKDLWKRAVDEQKKLVAEAGQEVDFEALQKMDFLHCCITEALRIHPPLIMVMRLCKKAFQSTDSKGRTYTIPKGDVVMVSPTQSHRIPTVFKQPEAFDPDRFGPDRAEDKAIPFAFQGFGGGRHSCMGSNFAYLQIKAIWSTMLRNFEIELVDPFPEPEYSSMVIGPKPCRVRFTRRKL